MTYPSRWHMGHNGAMPLRLLRRGERQRKLLALVIVAGVATGGLPKRHSGDASATVAMPWFSTARWRAHTDAEGSKGQTSLRSASFSKPEPVRVTIERVSPISPSGRRADSADWCRGRSIERLLRTEAAHLFPRDECCGCNTVPKPAFQSLHPAAKVLKIGALKRDESSACRRPAGRPKPREQDCGPIVVCEFGQARTDKINSVEADVHAAHRWQWRCKPLRGPCYAEEGRSWRHGAADGTVVQHLSTNSGRAKTALDVTIVHKGTTHDEDGDVPFVVTPTRADLYDRWPARRQPT
eukprot:6567008-Prymnesium_polylepis.1